MRNLTKVVSATGNYEVFFGDDLGSIANFLGEKDDAFIIADEFFRGSRWLEEQTFSRRVYFAAASEEFKSLQGVELLTNWLAANGASRKSHLIAVGGGVIQDVTAFVAATYFRGVGYSLVPTTLLAMADSCVGAKSSINVGRLKNQLGSFLGPTSVLVVPRLVETLPEREIWSGLGEIGKLAMIDSEAKFKEFQASLSRPLNEGALSLLVENSLLTKRAFVEIDEFDRGPRRILNFGHTMGHAIESASSYEVPHGVAVAIGCFFDCLISREVFGFGNLVMPSREMMLRVVSHCPTGSDWLDPTVLRQAINGDKKVARGTLSTVVAKDFGNFEIMLLDLDSRFDSLISDFA